MGYLQMGSVSRSDSLEGTGRQQKGVLALGMSEIYLLERVLRVGVAMVTIELRYGGALPSKDL
jgi:hypothetical protein